MAEPLLHNVVLSTKPCPRCVDAGAQPPMTLSAWRASQWGTPGSSGRYCEADCHCILVPDDALDDFPEIGKRIPLRGDPGPDAPPPIVIIHPREQVLARLMEFWNANIGKLPKEFYSLRVEQMTDYLLQELGKRGYKIDVRDLL